MSLSTDQSRKVTKLFSLALDKRGQAKEADLAAMKALRLCREADVTPWELANILAADAEQETARVHQMPKETPIASFVRDLNEAASSIDSLLGTLSGKKRRARA